MHCNTMYAFIAPTPLLLRTARTPATGAVRFLPGHGAPRPLAHRRWRYARLSVHATAAASDETSAPLISSPGYVTGAGADAFTYPTPTGVSAEMTLRARAARSIPDVFESLAESVGSKCAVIDEHHASGNIRWTYRELVGNMRDFSAGLQRLGLGAGDCVAMFAENSARWLVADQGVMRVGAAAAVRGIDAPIPELMYIYEHSESKALLVEDLPTLSKLMANGFDLSNVLFIVVLHGEAGSVPGRAPILTFDDVLAKGAAPSLDELEIEMRRSDVATVLYTSGTTGLPKGVVLTHGNILAQLDRICIGSIDPIPGNVFVSILPCWHIFERTASYYCFSKGMEIVYSNKRHFRDDLVKHKPHVLIAVPRVFENLYTAIRSKLERAEERQRRVAFFLIAVSLAFIRVRRSVQGLSLQAPLQSMNPVAKLFALVQFIALVPLYALAKALVWKKIIGATGGRVQLCVCGGGSVPDHLEDFFEAAGITICVGYGLTETSPVIANRFSEHNVRGSTGVPLPDTEVKIVDTATRLPVAQGVTGELMVSGPQVFSAYLRDDVATDKAFDKQGFFVTGDLAYVGPGGDIVITGRSKDTIVLSNGENIEPVPIEDSILSSPLIEQIMLVGQDEKNLCALVVPSVPSLQAAELVDKDTVDRIAELSVVGREEELRKLGDDLLRMKSSMGTAIVDAVRDGNRSRPNYQGGDRIQHIRLVLEPFSVENGMLTQTLKVKRNIVSEVYSKEIDVLFGR